MLKHLNKLPLLAGFCIIGWIIWSQSELDIDRYGRTVAEIQSNGQSVGLQMVREGQAIVYPQYLDGCADSRTAYLDAEAKAKQQQLAFWSQTNPIVPWEWRQGQRTILPPTTPIPTPTISPTKPPSNCDSAYPDFCIPSSPPDLDCPDIGQNNFTVREPDPHRFDRDRDGIGCEK